MLGIHRFYLGNIGMGVAMLFVGWLTFGIWPLIDWIVVLAGVGSRWAGVQGHELGLNESRRARVSPHRCT